MPALKEVEIRARARALIDATSPRKAAQILGIGRDTALSLAGGMRVHRGTLALVRERLRALDHASEGA